MRLMTTDTLIFVLLILGIVALVYMRHLEAAYFLGGYTLGRFT